MDHNKVNMSLDEIIKHNKSNTNRGRGSFRNRAGRRGGGGRGRGTRGRGAGGATGKRSRSRSQSRNRLGVSGGGIAGRGRGRGARRGRGGRAGTAMGRLSRRDMNLLGGPRARSRSASRNKPLGNNQRSRSQSRGRDARRGRSQSRNRGGQNNNTQRQRSRSRSRGRGNNANQRGGRGRGIAKINRNRLLVTGISTEALRAKKLINAISSVGLRSDQIVQPRKLNRLQNRGNTRNQNNVIKSQTFTRSRSLPRNKSATSLTVSVANEFAARKKLNRKRKNSGANQVGYLDKASLEKLTQLLGGAVHQSKRPGSVRSAGSNRSRKSNRSSRSNASRKRGRGSKNFSLQNALNPQLQQQIAQIQGRSFSNGVNSSPDKVTQPGINFTPTPHLTTTSLSERFSKM